MSGKTSRTKGHNFERQVAKEMRGLGFNDCETSRYANRKLDDACVDLTETGCFSIQCKAYKNQPNFRTELDKMPEDSNYNLVFHKAPRKRDLVVMYKEDFYEIIQMLKSEKLI